jgi:hypothetical protein
MKYKHVFFIWLLADAFLALGLSAFVIYARITSGNSDEVMMYLAITVYGIGISLPSLIAMSIFYYFYNKKAADKTDYKSVYVGLIIAINILYLLIGQYAMDITGEFNYFYIGSTLAGLLSFYLVDRSRIKKAAAAIQ